jgi:hypothetical protein
MCSIIEPIFFNFEGEKSYSEIIYEIDKLISKYERCIHKSKNISEVHITRRPKVYENLVIDKIKMDNEGKLPHWLEKQLEVEVNHNKIDVREIIAKEDNIFPTNTV